MESGEYTDKGEWRDRCSIRHGQAEENYTLLNWIAQICWTEPDVCL